MRVVLVSDVHLGGPEDPHQAAFLAWLRGLRADHLCLLGDVFDTWWHWGEVPFPQYLPVVEALRATGAGLTVLPGNHDFHAPRFFHGEDTPILPTAEAHRRWDGLRVQLAHGDHVDHSLGYRALTAVLRGRAFAAGVDRLAPDRAWSLLRGLSGRGAVRPAPGLIAAQTADARARLAAGCDLVVFGHTHAPGVHVFPEGTYVNLGDWVQHHTWAVVEDGRIHLEGG